VLMAVLLQIGSVLVLALGAALVSGWSSAWYVVLGGTAAIVPNGLFALRLALQRGRSPESYPVVFFLGQFAKIGLTVALLAAIHRWLGPLQWLPLLLGLIVALKAPLFALLYVQSQPEATNESGSRETSSIAAKVGSTEAGCTAARSTTSNTATCGTGTSGTGTSSTGTAGSVGNRAKGTAPGGGTTGSRREIATSNQFS
jgi:ATP synthase protein I